MPKIANLFRISQTEEKLKKVKIHSCSKATSTHYEVGTKVRKAIEDIGGTMPEDLPTPYGGLIMDVNLKSNLSLKKELRFNSNGKFKILMLSDIQETLDYDKRTLKGIDKIIEIEKPDLIILGGDNCDGTVLKTEKELREYLDIFSKPMESRNILWAHVFGNHDHDIDVDDIKKTKIYEEYEYCISKHTENIYGTTNFVLPIKYSNKNEIAFNIWGLDSNNLIANTNMPIDKNINLLKKPSMSCRWDVIHFEQLMWYWNSSKEIEEYCNKKIDGILFMHIPPWEFQYIVENPRYTNAKR